MKTRLACLILFLFLLSAHFTFAQNNQTDQKNELEKKIQEYQKKLDELNQQKNTLSSQIQYMDTQIYLTTLKIQETEQNIEHTKKEIDILSSKIEGLDTSLNYLSRLLLERIVERYKKRSISIFSLILDSSNATDFVNQMKYLQTAQENNQKLLIQVQGTKLNFEEQKKLREKKKVELDNLNNTLNQQKMSLNNQKNAKQRLFEITKNDEKTYQNLLEEAQKQLSAFKSFVQTAGGGVISANGFGEGSDGYYYSQRDERWAYKTIGLSNDNLLEVGCLIADIAMIMKKYGKNITPLDIASDANYFFSNTAYMLHPSKFSWPIGLNYTNISTASIDDEIRNGRPVIAGLYAGKYGTHYVILKQIDGGDYVMHDPYYGPDKKFSEYYSKNSIFVAAVFK